MKPWDLMSERWHDRWNVAVTPKNSDDDDATARFSVTQLPETPSWTEWWWSWWTGPSSSSDHQPKDGFRVKIPWTTRDGGRKATLDLTFTDSQDRDEFMAEAMMVCFEPSVDTNALRTACRRSLIGLDGITADGLDGCIVCLQRDTIGSSPETILLLLLAINRLCSVVVVETVP